MKSLLTFLVASFLLHRACYYLPKFLESHKKQRTYLPMHSLSKRGRLNTDFQHDEQETFLSNLPGPGKVEFVVDGHAALGNPTDPVLAAAGRMTMLGMLL